ncbi:MAG: PQQ-dependent sugar dehydrogenase [Pseudomonadales bacterium]
MKKFLCCMALIVVPAAHAADYQIEVVADKLSYPWSLAFLPDGSYLISLRLGEVRRISADGELGEPIAGGPPTYFLPKQSGYFDLALAPDFSESGIVYLAYAEGNADAHGTALMRARLVGNRFEDAETIFRAAPSIDTPYHFGGELRFLPDGTLLLTTGDGFDFREASQDTHSHLGKIIRLNQDGSAPADNPFADGKDGDPLVYSYGHRNTQGLALDPATGAIYMHEHGPKGGDELNLIKPGANYGWPVTSYGVNYSGDLVTPLTQAPGITDPLHYWVPSIAPSGLAFYSGDMFPEWRGDLLVGALVGRNLHRLDMEDGKVVGEEKLLAMYLYRIREVRQGPGGEVYFLDDGPQGQVLRISR